MQRWAAASPWPRYAGVWRQPAGWGSRRKAREDYNLYAVLAGSLELACGGRRLRLEVGSVALIPPGHPFADGDPAGRGTELFSAGFSLAVGGPDPLAALGLPALAQVADAGLLGRRCRELAGLGLSHGDATPESRMQARGLLDRILAQWLADGFAAGAFAHAAAIQPPPWLWRVVDHIETRLAFRLAVPALARLAELSPAHFTRIFAEHLGCPPRTWIRDRRLARARAVLMAEPHLPVNRVAGLCGFADAFQFSRMFSSHNGMPPEAWRRRHKSEPPTTAEKRNPDRG